MTAAAEMREQRGGPRQSQSRKEGLPAPGRAAKFGEIMECDALCGAGCALKASPLLSHGGFGCCLVKPCNDVTIQRGASLERLKERVG